MIGSAGSEMREAANQPGQPSGGSIEKNLTLCRRGRCGITDRAFGVEITYQPAGAQRGHAQSKFRVIPTPVKMR